MDQKPSNEELANRYYELEEADKSALDELIWEVRPLESPYGFFDNLDDPSKWLEEHLAEPPAAILLGVADEDTGALAEEYVSEVEAKGGSLPSHFAQELGALHDLADAQKGFREFFAEWRKKAMPLLAKHLGDLPRE